LSVWRLLMVLLDIPQVDRIWVNLPTQEHFPKNACYERMYQ